VRTLAVGRRVVVEVPATSANLGPGFDCFGLALDWRERVEVEVTSSGVAVDVTGEGSDLLPRDETHLVVRCLTEGLDDLGLRAPGLVLRGHNTIPHGRGLGSSSAAIVAGLVAARALARVPEDRTWLLRHAFRIEGHPDNVAAAVHGGFVMAYGQGGHVAVVQGRVHPAVRAAGCTAADAGRAALLVHALAEDPRLLHAATQDWLHQRYREPAMPDAYALMSRLRVAGFAAAISGAGPSVVVLGTEEDLAGLETAEPGTRFHRAGIGGPARAL
jgi:homoserine kinase